MSKPNAEQTPVAKLSDVIRSAKALVDARRLLNMVSQHGDLSMVRNARQSGSEYIDDGSLEVTNPMRFMLRDCLLPLVEQYEKTLRDAGIDPGSTGGEWDEIDNLFHAIRAGHR